MAVQVIINQPDTYSTTTRLSPRNRVAIGTSSDLITYVGPYPNQTNQTRVVTWTWAVP